MEDELQMEGNEYNIALFIFVCLRIPNGRFLGGADGGRQFVPYILFEVPSNILIKRMAPSTWLALLMVCWGICTIGQGLITNNAGLQAMRFLLVR